MSRGDLNISRWLEAYSERHTGISTYPGNVALADIAGDGNYQLVLADVKIDKDGRSKMRVYKGMTVKDISLPDVPSSIISFYTDQLEPRIPAVGVACGVKLYMYKNNKPYFKFQVPSLPLLSKETEIWNEISESGITHEDVDKLVKELSNLPYDALSGRSQELLNTPTQRTPDLVKKIMSRELRKLSPITCMATLKKNSQDKYDVCCPVLATDSGNIYILDPQTFTILHQANSNVLKSSPLLLRASGIFGVDFRIIIACREGEICLLKRGWLEGKCIVQLTENIVDVIQTPAENLIEVATVDKMLSCFTKRGNKLWTIKLSQPVSCLCLITLQHININLVAVGMRNGTIHLYHERECVDQMTVPDSPSVITFGQMGQEEHVLTIVTVAGTVIFRILKRTADFHLNISEHVSQLQSKPLPLPRRSKLFLEQSMREKQNATDMHQTFQQDLVRLRLNSARELVQKSAMQSDVINRKDQIKLSAKVLGLGPLFTVIFELENMESFTKAIEGLRMVLHVKPTLYVCSTNQITIPFIPPNFSYKVQVLIEEVLQDGAPNLQTAQSESLMRVFIMKKSQLRPVLAATVNLPPKEI